MVKQAILGHPITVFGTGKQSRCFTHVRDVVGALVALSQEPKAVGQVFNIGSSTEITIENLAKLIKKTTRSKSEIHYIPYDEAYEEGFEDMPRRVPNISKAAKAIGYKPTLDLNDILKDVIEQQRNGNAL